MTLPPTDLQVLARRHDVTDRRNTGMAYACQALTNCVDDLLAFASDPKIVTGVAYSVAERLTKIVAELEQFKARDLINLREQAS